MWTVPGPGDLWEFCFGREDDFHFLHYIFGKSFLYCAFVIVGNNKGLCVCSYLIVCFRMGEPARGYECIYPLHNISVLNS